MAGMNSKIAMQMYFARTKACIEQLFGPGHVMRVPVYQLDGDRKRFLFPPHVQLRRVSGVPVIAQLEGPRTWFEERVMDVGETPDQRFEMASLYLGIGLIHNSLRERLETVFQVWREERDKRRTPQTEELCAGMIAHAETMVAQYEQGLGVVFEDAGVVPPGWPTELADDTAALLGELRTLESRSDLC